jgi:hypothetical protein
LTKWKDPGELEVLAAAYAEAADFASAVEWQRKAVLLNLREEDRKSCRERLFLYLEGQPYRQK